MNGDAAPPAQKRKPPKLRPPKLRKGSTSNTETTNSNEQRVNGVSDSNNSNSPSEKTGSSFASPRQNHTGQSSPEPAPQVEKQTQRTRHHRRPRRPSTQSQDPNLPPQAEREKSDASNLEQRRVQERRVSHVLHPPGAEGQIQRTGETQIAPNPAGGAVEQVTETREVNPESKKSDQLKLRLDLNLDVEIELKAKIRGDLTLQLL